MNTQKITADQLNQIQVATDRIITSLKSRKVGPCGIGLSGLRVIVSQSCPELRDLPEQTCIELMQTLCEKSTVSDTAIDTSHRIWILFLEELCISEKAVLSVTSLPLVEYDVKMHEFALICP